MFFILSKIFWALAAPLNLVFVLLTAALTCVFFKKARGAKILAGAAGVFLALFGILPTGHNMLVLLESRYERPAQMPEWINVVLVLGGSFNTAVSDGRGIPALNDGAERLTEALALARRYPNAAVIFSGGNGLVGDGLHEGRTEAQDVEMFLSQSGFVDERVLYEDESRNTYENIKFTRNLFGPMPEETWILVTSAYHMPRAVAVMKNLKWQGTILPYPVDYRTDGRYRLWPHSFDILGHMYEAHVALREYIGLAAYHMAGKIALPLR